MEQYTDSQYDDDLTVGVDDFEESFDTGDVDLFEFSGDDDSPIARLKTIVLSLDWEITDKVLTQFNEELLDLKDIWAGDDVKLVYVQALGKISKYIFQQKSDSHPNAIKLLLTLYYDLEKIVLDTNLSENEKKEILHEDIKKFEHLKHQITISSSPASKKEQAPKNITAAPTLTEQGEPHPTLFNLKACILGMDWEITERELSELGKELRNLESEFAGSKAKMILLQGIGALGGYIRLKKSNAHADAFKLLYSFYEGLEKIIVNDLSTKEERAVLLPEVEKFEAFKQIVSSTITPEAVAGKADDNHDDDFSSSGSADIAPAFADIPEETQGFQADAEIEALAENEPLDVESRLDNFFSEDTVAEETGGLAHEAEEQIDSIFADQGAEELPQAASVSAEEALRGVDVETEADDDSGEEALPTQKDGLLAPALADSDEEYGFNSESVETAVADDSGDETISEIEGRLGGFFEDEESSDQGFDVDPAVALEGVDVETDDDEADDDQLPFTGEEVSPALFGNGDTGDLAEETASVAKSDDSFDINDQISDFFGDDNEIETIATLSDVDAGVENDSDFEDVQLPFGDEEVVPVLFRNGDSGESDDGSEYVSEEGEVTDREGQGPGIFTAEDDNDTESVVEAETPHVDGAGTETGDELREEMLSYTADESSPDLFENGDSGELGAETVYGADIDTIGRDEQADGDVHDSVFIATEDDAEILVESEDQDSEKEMLAHGEEETVLLLTDEEESEEGDDVSEEPSEVLDAQPDAIPGGDIRESADEPAASEVETDVGREYGESEKVMTDGEERPDSVSDGADEAFVEEEDLFQVAPDEGESDVEEPPPGFSDGEVEQQGEGGTDVAPAFSLQRDEIGAEEVIFEAVAEEESASSPADTIPVAIMDSSSLVGIAAAGVVSSFGSDSDEEEFFAAIDDRVDEPGEFQMELLEDADDDLESTVSAFGEEPYDGIAFPAEEVDDTDGDVSGHIDTERVGEQETLTFANDDILTDLRAGISSLGVEINDAIVQGILSEINRLRHRMTARPLEKIFLQLLSTVVQHIGRYKYESSSEAHGLMLSVFDKLDMLESLETGSNRALDVLLAETSKVLLWQQKMLDRQGPMREDQHELLDPAFSAAPEEGTMAGSNEELYSEYTYASAAGDEGFDAEAQGFRAVLEKGSDDIETLSESDSIPAFESVSREYVSKELESLKKSLQAEIAELRDQIQNLT